MVNTLLRSFRIPLFCCLGYLCEPHGAETSSTPISLSSPGKLPPQPSTTFKTSARRIRRLLDSSFLRTEILSPEEKEEKLLNTQGSHRTQKVPPRGL